MAKRIADKELTDRNWDQEDEGEEVSFVWLNVGVCEGDLTFDLRSPAGRNVFCGE